MSEILSRAQTEQMNIAFAKGWRGPYGTPCGMEADMSRLLDSHESLRQAERRGWSAAERHSLMWQTAVRQGEMLTTENRCLRERVEELEAQLRLWRSQTITFGGMPTDGEARAALEADDE